MKKLAFLSFCLVFLLSGCGKEPVTQVYLPVDAGDKTGSAAASDSTPSKTESSTASDEAASAENVSNQTGSKGSSLSKPNPSKPDKETAVSSAASSSDDGKAQEEARKKLLAEKKKEKAALELQFKRTKQEIDYQISDLNDKIKAQEALIAESEAELKQLEKTLEELQKLSYGSRVEEQVKQKIEAEKEKRSLLNQELVSLTGERDVLKEKLTAAEREYNDQLFKISAEILDLS